MPDQIFYIAAAEDNESAQRAIARAARRAFASEGVNVSVAPSANEFIKQVSEGVVPRLILLDITLYPIPDVPPRDGWDIFQALKRMPSLKDVPTFFFSSSSGMEDVNKAKNLGAHGYLVKPSTREMIVMFEMLRDKYLLGKKVNFNKIEGCKLWID